MTKLAKVTEIGPATNGGAEVIEFSEPYTAAVAIEGSADLIFHRWNIEGIESKAAAAKGSKAKKTDDLESYVYRDEGGFICMPGSYLCGAIVHAAKFRQDPRSTRKSAMDLYKAGVVPLTALASLGTKDWDYEHRERVMVQRNGVTRVRPAFKAGWRVEFDLLVTLPEYIRPSDLNEVVAAAGRLVGVADHRPTYGRFNVVGFSIR